MSRRFIVVLAALVWLGVGSPPVQAAPFIDPFEIAFNVDGTVTPGDTSGLVNGLGAFSFTVTGAGAHYVAGFFDYEIDEPDNTFFNELGSHAGSLPVGLSGEIDEPGWFCQDHPLDPLCAVPGYGDIYDNFLAGDLSNSGPAVGTPDDVSVALGWNFVLDPGKIGIVTFNVTDVMPTSGFYLKQNDPASQASIYFTTNLTIRDEQIPEPATLLLLGTGLLLLGARARPRR